MRVSGGWMLVGGGLIAVAAACGAAEPGAAAAVDRLVPRLASGSATNRDEAEWALLDLGSAILPQVVAAAMKREAVLSWRYRVAIGYLAVVLVMFLGVAGFLSLRIVPIYAKIIDEFGMQRPASLELASAMSGFVVLASAMVML